jgi:hypothetical protein
VLFVTSAASAANMPLAEVQKGMKGYGLTVFEGTTIEKFDVEILGVLNNIGPDQNLILARVDHPVVRRAGIIAGMSGSPVFLDGKCIGALAYAWQFAKEPVAGITPIDEMLKIASKNARGGGGATVASATPRFTGTELLTALSKSSTDDLFKKMMSDFSTKSAASVAGAQRIALPLSLSSFAAETITRFSPYLGDMGFIAAPSGSSATAATGSGTSGTAAGHFTPGDPIGAVLLNGDFNVAASGTVSYVDGNSIYAFGHPFLDMGEVRFPMAKSEVVTVLPSVASSFKFSNSGQIVGAFHQDRGAGIMGVLGEKADMIPVELTVEGAGPSKKYNVSVVKHAQLSPLILAMAADTVISGSQRAAGERTVLLESELRLKGIKEPIFLRDGWAGAQARQAIPQYLAVIAGYLISNEFQDAELESVKVRIRHEDDLRTARLLEASLITPENGRIVPGDTVKVRTVVKPFRGESFVETFEVKIPDDQPSGNAYLLVGSGSMMNAVDFMLVPPDPRTLGQVVEVLHRLRPSTDLTVGLYSNGEGAVTSGVYLPNLPPSMRAVVSADTSNAAQASVKYYATGHQAKPLGYIVDGALKIDINVRPAL